MWKRAKNDYLLSHHRQNFQFNTIEFIKTCPGTAGCQTFEKLGDNGRVKIKTKYLLLSEKKRKNKLYLLSPSVGNPIHLSS